MRTLGNRKINHRRRGAVAVLVAMCLTLLLGFVAIAVDGGLLLTEHRRAQATADAAALAAATVIYSQYPTYQGAGPPSEAKNAALALAAANGYTNDTTQSKVEVAIPPTSGPYMGKPGYAEVVVTWYQNRYFSTVFGSTKLPVRARAVSRGAWVAPNAGVLVLDYTGKGALNTQGNGAFTETGGPVIVNSNNSSAAIDTGNGVMKAPEFDITGGLTISGSGSLQGQVNLGVHPTPDPLAYLPEPSLPSDGEMTVTNLGTGNKQYVLTPGRYNALPNFELGDVVILKQASANGAGGIYYIDGGGFKSTGATIMMDPDTSGGVMIYNRPSSSAQSQKIQITGNENGSVNLAPLTSGPYSGMLLWQERNSNVDLLVEGNGSFTLKGTFYAAGALLQVNGNGGTSFGDNGTMIQASQIGSQFIVKDLSLGGNGNVAINYKSTDVARTRIIQLVE